MTTRYIKAFLQGMVELHKWPTWQHALLAIVYMIMAVWAALKWAFTENASGGLLFLWAVSFLGAVAFGGFALYTHNNNNKPHGG